MSYLRGPLTREEVSGLSPQFAEASAIGRRSGDRNRPASDLPPASGPAAPPPSAAPPASIAGLPQAFYLVSGSSDAVPFLLVKYAVRYKGLGESVAARGYPLRSPSLAELLEEDPISIDEDQVHDAPPAPLRYGGLPEGFAAASLRQIERAVRDRLADRLALSVWVDPMTGETSAPGESATAFAARVGTGGATMAFAYPNLFSGPGGCRTCLDYGDAVYSVLGCGAGRSSLCFRTRHEHSADWSRSRRSPIRSAASVARQHAGSFA
jgi:hypothetical protein